MPRTLRLLPAAIMLLLISTVSAYDVDSMLNLVQNGKWVKLPTQASPIPPIISNINIVVDCDSNRIFMFGSDVGGTWNNNTVYMFTLSTLKWRWIYPDDNSSSYKKLKSPVFGDTSKFWAVCSTGHPVPSRLFDAAKYIPGKSCILANFFPDQNSTLANALYPGLNLTPGNSRNYVGQPSSWLFDTRTLTWKHLTNAVSPNPWQCPMGVSPDGATVIQLESNGSTWHFDWSDSTWKKATVTGTPPSPSMASLEYDTERRQFVCVGGTTYNFHAYDPETRVWTRLETTAPGDMNGCHTGYDTLNKVLIAHIPYGTTTGFSATIARPSAASKWDTVRYVGGGGGSLPPFEGASFKGEYDLRNNVFFYGCFATLGSTTHRDFWVFRYAGAPSAMETAPASPVLTLSATPNPFRNTAEFALNLPAASNAVSLALYATDGRKVASLHNGPLDAGRHAFRIPAGFVPAGGMYLLKFTANGLTRCLPVMQLR